VTLCSSAWSPAWSWMSAPRWTFNTMVLITIWKHHICVCNDFTASNHCAHVSNDVMVSLCTCMWWCHGNKNSHASLPHAVIFIYLRFDNVVYSFNKNLQLSHDVVKAPKLTSHEKVPNIKKWFKDYMQPTITPALQIGTTHPPNLTPCTHHF
jgi:hypothetical protein